MKATLFLLAFMHLATAAPVLLTDEDLAPHANNADKLRLLRNEIFARHGYIFKDADLDEHFRAQPWYEPKSQNVDNLLTDVDKKNIERLLVAEEQANDNMLAPALREAWQNLKNALRRKNLEALSSATQQPLRIDGLGLSIAGRNDSVEGADFEKNFAKLFPLEVVKNLRAPLYWSAGSSSATFCFSGKAGKMRCYLIDTIAKDRVALVRVWLSKDGT